MKKIISSICSMILLIFILINVLGSSEEIKVAINFAFIIWKENLFPFLFPMFIISDLLINYGFVAFLSELTKNICNKWLKVSRYSSYVFILGLLTGFPSSAKYINQLYENGNITKDESSKILLFTHFSNPLFIIGTIASTFLGNTKLAILIFICHYIPNIVIALVFRNYHPSKKENTKVSFKNALIKMHETRVFNPKKLGSILSEAIINSINTLLLILGTISIFLSITTILNSIIDLGTLNNAILNGIIEMSQGLKYVSLLNISLRIKTTISVMFISFGGLSVHLQVMSILSNTKIKYLPFFISRIIHALLSGLLSFILFPIFS